MTTIRALPGFRWQLVDWESADEPPRDHCSYSACGAPIPEDSVPLIMTEPRTGRTARFCDRCMVELWGFLPAEPEPDAEPEP